MTELNGHEYEVATLADFEPQVEWVQLPSQRGTKKAVQLQRPDIISLIDGEGDVPDVLTSIVLSQVNGKQKQDMAIDRETLPQLMKSLNVVAMAAFVHPKLTEQALRGMNFEDKAFVFSWALGVEYVPAERFRQEQDANVEPVPAVQKVRPNAKRGNRHK